MQPGGVAGASAHSIGKKARFSPEGEVFFGGNNSDRLRLNGAFLRGIAFIPGGKFRVRFLENHPMAMELGDDQ